MPKKSKSSNKSSSKSSSTKLSKKSISALLVGVVIFLAAVVLIILFLLGVFDNKSSPPSAPSKPTPRRFDGDIDELMNKSKKLRNKLRNESIQKRLANPNGKMTCLSNFKSPDDRATPCAMYATDKDDDYSIPPLQPDYGISKNNYGFIPIDKETDTLGDNYSDPSRGGSGGVPSKYMLSQKQCSSDDQCGWSSENNYAGPNKKTWTPFCCDSKVSKCRSCQQIGRTSFPKYSGNNIM